MIRSAFRFAALIVAAAAMAAAAAELPVRRSAANGVTVAVRPLSVAARDPVWQFEVSFDTHSQDLADDLLKSASLVPGNGKASGPIGWDGAGPGGHHRFGVLKFKAIDSMPAAIELRIARANEPAPRVFRWDLK